MNQFDRIPTSKVNSCGTVLADEVVVDVTGAILFSFQFHCMRAGSGYSDFFGTLPYLKYLN